MEQFKLSHIESIHEQIKYPCDLCEYQAPLQGSLNTHIKSVHEKVKYPCNICEYEATGKGDVKRHIQSVHNNQVSL